MAGVRWIDWFDGPLRNIREDMVNWIDRPGQRWKAFRRRRAAFILHDAPPANCLVIGKAVHIAGSGESGDASQSPTRTEKRDLARIDVGRYLSIRTQSGVLAVAHLQGNRGDHHRL